MGQRQSIANGRYGIGSGSIALRVRQKKHAAHGMRPWLEFLRNSEPRCIRMACRMDSAGCGSESVLGIVLRINLNNLCKLYACNWSLSSVPFAIVPENI